MTPKFVSLQSFVDQLRKAKFDPGRVSQSAQPYAARAAVVPLGQQEQQFTQLKQELLKTYERASKDMAGTFVDDAGLHIDCIREDLQPGLQDEAGQGQIAEPPPFADLPGAVGAQRAAAVASPLAEDKKDLHGNQKYCPEGYVPVLRVTPERVAQAGGPTQFFQKAPGGGRHPTRGAGGPRPRPQGGGAGGGPVGPFQIVQGALHAYAHAFQQVPNHGGQSWLNLWNPDPAPGVFSLSQQWWTGGSGSGLQTVEGGWHVYPDLYSGSTATRLFIYFTADGYVNTGSYNLTRRPGQGGFVQTDNSWVLGGSFQTTSTPGGDQQGFLMQWQQDASGNWWLYLQTSGNPVAVGYYPVALFAGGALSQQADGIDFGGEVCSQPGQRQTGQMGSGQTADAGAGQAAFHKDIGYLPQVGGSLTEASLVKDERDAPVYTVDLHNDSGGGGGTFFYYGGPGGQF